MTSSLVGSEMCIRDSSRGSGRGAVVNERDLEATVLAMLSVAKKPIGMIILVDSRGFKAPHGQR
eukprot:11061701-Prorocentrum_lima.AAC.1